MRHPMKRTYSKMKDSGVEWIGEIPNGWEIFEIEDLYSIRNSKVNDECYQPLSVTMKGILPQLKTVAKSDDHDNRKLVKRGDFVINSRSDRRGSCGISQYEGSVSLINIVLKPNRQMYEQYYNLIFRTVQFSDEFYKWGHGIVDDLWTTSWQDMKKISVTFPPLPEQTSIANYLDSKCEQIDSIISDTKACIEEYKKWKSAIIFEAVTKGLDPNAEMKDSGVEWIGKIPKGWKVTRIALQYEIVLGKMLNSMVKNKTDQSNYLCAVNIKWNGVDVNIQKTMCFSDIEKQQYLLEDGDVIIVEGGMSGTSCIYHNEFFPCYIQNSVHRCRPYDSNDGRFLYYWMHAICSVGYIESICNKSTIMHYTKEKVEDTPIVAFSVIQQTSIANYLDDKCVQIDEIISEKESLISDLEAYKKSLIYEAVTGKIKVS